MDQILSLTLSLHAMAPSRVVLLFQFYPLLLLPLLLLQTVSTFPHKIPRLSTHPKETLVSRNLDDSFNPKDFKTYYYTQTIDHFNYAPQSYTTFKQRYVINCKHWPGPKSNSPILAYFGFEAALDSSFDFVGFLTENAPHFKSLCVYIEHRFYGKSNPLGSMEKAMKNNTIRGYLNSAQALADYAEILVHVKETFSTPYSPIIVIGLSYAGALASWFRLKYPHIALGALASSAPILYFDDITPQNTYDWIVTKDFKEVSESCYETIRKSWAEIDEVASKPSGLYTLSQRFKACSNLNNSSELKQFLENMYDVAAQFDAPPDYPVSMVCKGIDEAPKATDIIGRIFAGVVSYLGNKTCYDTNYYIHPDETSIGFQWQTCSEMVTPFGRGENDTMFQADPFNITRFISKCKDLYGVTPRSHWITTYYGGHDIKLVLKRFGSNIIFSNGLRDPYSGASVLEDISESIVAVTTLNGSHGLDIYSATKTDPEWLVLQRNTEIKIIDKWLDTYYSDLQALKK